jgi:P4 family phage/plasmid primase-like protien
MLEMMPDPDADVEAQPRMSGVQSDIAQLVVVNVLHTRFRFVAGIGWHEYQGGRWVSVPKSGRVVRDTVREYMGQRVDDLRRDGRAEQAVLWKAAMNAQNIGGILQLAEAMNGVLTGHDDLDRGPDLVNCINGVLDLRTGMLGRSNPGLLLTKQTGAPYNPDASSATWSEILEAVPVDTRDWLQVRCGQALTGYAEDSLVLTVGGGENGKSAFMSAIMRAFGTYAGLISHRVLLQGAAGQHPTELMDLRGLRLALLEETPEEGNLDTHQLKSVIGTPFISARRMRQDSITFPTTHSLFINTNHFPLVATTDHGTWRRLVACRFPFRFITPGVADELRQGERWGDPDLKARIQRDETLPAAALAWVIQGARRWYADRSSLHRIPPSVAAATREWRTDSDVGYQFATEHLEPAPHHLVPVSYLAEKFNEFLEAQAKRKWSNRVIAGRLPQSIKAALGREITPEVVKVQPRHLLGIADPFDAARHQLTEGKTVRAWVDLRLRSEHVPILEPGPADLAQGDNGNGHEVGHDPDQMEMFT